MNPEMHGLAVVPLKISFIVPPAATRVWLLSPTWAIDEPLIQGTNSWPPYHPEQSEPGM